MNDSFILLGCNCVNYLTRLSADVSLLQYSLNSTESVCSDGGAMAGLDELQLAKTPLTLT